ncbi:MAG: hypothetical protein AB7L13_06280 [Acidimicrobiia bacterium]
MPWCDDCAKFWTPSSMKEDGRCPTCGRPLSAETNIDPKKLSVRQLANASAGPGAEDDTKAPWHFKLLVVAIVAYLLWRLIQLVVWAVT